MDMCHLLMSKSSAVSSSPYTSYAYTGVKQYVAMKLEIHFGCSPSFGKPSFDEAT